MSLVVVEDRLVAFNLSRRKGFKLNKFRISVVAMTGNVLLS